MMTALGKKISNNTTTTRRLAHQVIYNYQFWPGIIDKVWIFRQTLVKFNIIPQFSIRWLPFGIVNYYSVKVYVTHTIYMLQKVSNKYGFFTRCGTANHRWPRMFPPWIHDKNCFIKAANLKWRANLKCQANLKWKANLKRQANLNCQANLKSRADLKLYPYEKKLLFKLLA